MNSSWECRAARDNLAAYAWEPQRPYGGNNDRRRPAKGTLSSIRGLNERRPLARLFSLDPQPCALQLWILQIKVDNEHENRILYGRVLPYSFSNNTWSATEDDNFEFLGAAQRRSSGSTCTSAAIDAQSFSNCFALARPSQRSVALSTSSPRQSKCPARHNSPERGTLIYRPAAYLLNRGAHDRHSLASPHDGAGAFSASVVQTDKNALFRIGENYDIALTNLVVRQLNDDTGPRLWRRGFNTVRRYRTHGVSGVG